MLILPPIFNVCSAIACQEAPRKKCCQFFMNNIDSNFRTLTVQSSPEKFHLYFKCPVDGMDYRNRSQGNSGCGFDIRGNGGYVLGPGSIHPVSKSFYTILAADEIAEAPVWVKQWTLNRTLAASSPDSSCGLGDKLNRLSAELRSRITADIAVGSRSEVSISVMATSLLYKHFGPSMPLDLITYSDGIVPFINHMPARRCWSTHHQRYAAMPRTSVRWLGIFPLPPRRKKLKLLSAPSEFGNG